MRLIKYIIEAAQMEDFDEKSKSLEPGTIIGKMIRSGCKKWINDVKKNNHQGLFRGVKNSRVVMFRKKPRKDREPVDTDLWDHIALDDGFEEKYGWRPRSQAIMTSTDIHQAHGYGDLYIILPIGDYRYLFSPSIRDLYAVIDDVKFEYNLSSLRPSDTDYSDYPEPHKTKAKEIYDRANADKAKAVAALVNRYRDDKLFTNTNLKGEVMLDCKEYWAIDWRVIIHYVISKRTKNAAEPNKDLLLKHKYDIDIYKEFFQIL